MAGGEILELKFNKLVKEIGLNCCGCGWDSSDGQSSLLNVEVWFEELLSYAMKNQLKAPEVPY